MSGGLRETTGSRQCLGVPLLAAAVAFAAACFSPDFTATQCSDLGECPPGYVCGADNICARTGGSDDDAGVQIDADPNAPDARVGLLDGGGCWTWDPVAFDPCDVPEPTSALSLGLNGLYIYNSDTGTLTDPNGQDTQPARGEVDGIDIVSVDSVVIPPQSQLRVVGTKPVAFASEGSIVIDGSIDASSDRNAPGAGANPAICQPGAGAGQGNPTGASGGGGGGFGSTGGMGGDGSGLQGGSGGPTLGPPPLHGGCPGGKGGAVIGMIGAQGGPGGGGIALVSQISVTINGGVEAGGAGGAGGSLSGGGTGGGAGGGAGGMISLDAPTVSVNTAGAVTANGGGGGEGARQSGPGAPGEDGQPSGAIARGGMSGGGGPGGDGGAGTALAGMPGLASGMGGGGGGGSVGYVVVHTTDFSLPGLLSPPPVLMTE